MMVKELRVCFRVASYVVATHHYQSPQGRQQNQAAAAAAADCLGPRILPDLRLNQLTQYSDVAKILLVFQLVSGLLLFSSDFPLYSQSFYASHSRRSLIVKPL